MANSFIGHWRNVSRQHSQRQHIGIAAPNGPQMKRAAPVRQHRSRSGETMRLTSVCPARIVAALRNRPNMSLNTKIAIGAPKLRLVAIGEKPQPPKPAPAMFAGTSAVTALIGAWRLIEAARADMESGQSTWRPCDLAFYIERAERSMFDLRAALDPGQSDDLRETLEQNQ